MNNFKLKENINRKFLNFRNEIYNFITKLNRINKDVVANVDHASLEIPVAHISMNISNNIMYTIRDAAIKKMSVYIKTRRSRTK